MPGKVLASLLIAAAVATPALAKKRPDFPNRPGQQPYLDQAGHGVATLQSWYTESTGLYQTIGWWNSANAITMLVNYSRAARTEAYFPVFANTLKTAPKKYPGFLNNYLDDEGWWALAWVDAYDLTRQPEYLATAVSIFTDMAGQWDGTCGGGIWWSKDHDYKNAIANELFLSVAAHLATRAKDKADRNKYRDWAQKEWAWFSQTGMINTQGLINDGLDLHTCKNNGKTTWTYNQGVVLGGLAELSQSTHDRNLLKTASGIANAAITQLSDPNGVLHDPCEPSCGADGIQFKGIFMRNLMELDEKAKDARYRTFADTNAESIWTHSQGPDYQFGQVWSGPFDKGNAGSQSSALDAFVAATTMP